jgi:hypothetical protein
MSMSDIGYRRHWDHVDAHFCVFLYSRSKQFEGNGSSERWLFSPLKYRDHRRYLKIEHKNVPSWQNASQKCKDEKVRLSQVFALVNGFIKFTFLGRSFVTKVYSHFRKQRKIFDFFLCPIWPIQEQKIYLLKGILFIFFTQKLISEYRKCFLKHS